MPVRTDTCLRNLCLAKVNKSWNQSNLSVTWRVQSEQGNVGVGWECLGAQSLGCGRWEAGGLRAGPDPRYCSLYPYKDKPGQISYGCEHLSSTFQLRKQQKKCWKRKTS